jgi:hypothetical protein
MIECICEPRADLWMWKYEFFPSWIGLLLRFFCRYPAHLFICSHAGLKWTFLLSVSFERVSHCDWCFHILSRLQVLLHIFRHFMPKSLLFKFSFNWMGMKWQIQVHFSWSGPSPDPPGLHCSQFGETTVHLSAFYPFRSSCNFRDRIHRFLCFIFSLLLFFIDSIKQFDNRIFPIVVPIYCVLPLLFHFRDF